MSRSISRSVVGFLLLVSTAVAGFAQPTLASQPLPTRQAPPSLGSVTGGKHVIVVRARTTTGAVCRARVSVGRVRQSLPAVHADKHGRVGWRWLILPTSPTGRWRIAVHCRAGGRSGSTTRSVIVITRSPRTHGAIGDPHSLSAIDGTIAGLGAGSCGPFPPGQCTCLAYQKRRDVYDTAVAHGIPRGGTRAAGPDFYVWDGQQWLVNARRAGIPTGSHPVAGALVVWGVPDSPAYGHVAYVEQATSDTHVLVTECNYDWHGSCRTVWMNPQAVAHLQGYVYGGPAGGGPSSGESGPVGDGIAGSRNLWFVKTKNVGSGHVEVHSATAGSGYQAAGQHSVTWFSPADADNGWFQMVGSDLFFIKTKNVGSGHVEVHSATAGSGYQAAGQHSVTWFSPADANNGWFQMVGRDLYFIKTRNTGSGNVEVHSATAASGYQSGQHSVTWFSPADADNGWFQMVGSKG
ncbi:MAG TPA: CHAP domain-containing protein [Conexibacter sp.]|nr:CHAP domain-containing protein [Conexibacter sp.]